MIKRFLKHGYFFDIKYFDKFLYTNMQDITFKEAYEKSGLILNITVSCHGDYQGYRLLNYLTTPHVLIRTAVLASSAIPYFFSSVELKCKNSKGEIINYDLTGARFIDGSIKADLPT
mmetsp:Transcript_28389/g.5158  ORF Transcript_28389/g.5158 Transcript_28389/m.5158 type:complete len:117 (+) Transcript_28389:770-1120(+)